MRHRLNRRFFYPIVIFIGLLFMESCGTVPLTGRSQLNLLPESSMVEMSLTNYDEFLSTNTISLKPGTNSYGEKCWGKEFRKLLRNI